MAKPNFLDGVSGFRPHYASMQPSLLQPVSLEVSGLGTQYENNKTHNQRSGPSQHPANDFLAEFKVDYQKAQGQKKVEVVTKALTEAKDSPKLTKQIMTAALEETSGTERGQVMAGMIKFNPTLSHTIAHMGRNLTSLHNAHLEGLGQDVAYLPLNRLDVRGAFLADNVDLRQNNLAGANFDGVTAPGLITDGAKGDFSAKGAHFEQRTPTNNVLNNLAAGAFTGFTLAKPGQGDTPLPKIAPKSSVGKVGLASPFSMEPTALPV